MNKLLISTCVVAALGAIAVGSLLAEAKKDHGEYGGMENHGGYGSGGYGGEHGGYGSNYMPGSQYLGGEHGGISGGLGGHGDYLGGSHGLNSQYLGGGSHGAGYGSHNGGYNSGYNGELGHGSHGGYGGHGGHESNLYGGHHGGHHQGEGHHQYGKRHGSGTGQVKALLKGAGRSMLAQNPELGRKVHEITSNPSVRRQVEKLRPKINKISHQAKPFLREGAKVMKGKLTETVNQQNLKQGYMAAEGAGLHHNQHHY